MARTTGTCMKTESTNYSNMIKAQNYQLNVRVGNYIYTVDVIKSFFRENVWTAMFKNPDIDNFEQTWPVKAKDVIEYINEEYPERV